MVGLETIGWPCVVLCVLYQVLYVHIEQQPLGGVEILAM